jgi:5-methylcytosine-specific restriction protein A
MENGWKIYDGDLRQLSTSEWFEILQDEEISFGVCLDVLSLMLSMEDYALNAKKISEILGFGALTLRFRDYAIRIAEKFDIDLEVRKTREFKWFPLFFNGKYQGKYYFWQLKPNLVEALKQLNAANDSRDNPLETIIHTPSAPEGQRRQYYTTRYERRAASREAAIAWHKTQYGELSCYACGFNFEAVYGELGKNFIEVHHNKPLYSLVEEVHIDPTTDLTCLCSNCHSMIHRKKDVILSPDELKAIIKGG